MQWVASRDQFADDVAMDVGQAEVAARVMEREAFMVEAEKPQERGVEVMDMDDLLGGGEPKLVGGAMDHAALHAPPRPTTW